MNISICNGTIEISDTDCKDNIVRLRIDQILDIYVDIKELQWAIDSAVKVVEAKQRKEPKDKTRESEY